MRTLDRRPLLLLALALVLTLAPACSDDSDDGGDDGGNNNPPADNDAGGEEEPIGNVNVKPLEDGAVGANCAEHADCCPADKTCAEDERACLTSERVAELFGNPEFEPEVKNGYCTFGLPTLPICQLNDATQCPPDEGAFCFPANFVMPGVGLCLRLCDDADDCAADSGQVCVSAEDFGFSQAAIDQYYSEGYKICLPEDLFEAAKDDVETQGL